MASARRRTPDVSLIAKIPPKVSEREKKMSEFSSMSSSEALIDSIYEPTTVFSVIAAVYSVWLSIGMLSLKSVT